MVLHIALSDVGQYMNKQITSLGLMSGTSLDGIDAALVTSDGTSMLEFGNSKHFPYHNEERHILRQSLDLALDIAQAGGDWDDKASWPDILNQAEKIITYKHIAAVQEMKKANPHIALIGFHGQTVLHNPTQKRTIQIGDAQKLARATGISVIGDMRQADIKAGGQGAPLVPLFHQALCENEDTPMAVINIGGVANLTFIDADSVIAFDTGPGNALIDDWAQRYFSLPYDKAGAIARRGTIDDNIVSAFMAHPYFETPPPKSLDRLDFANALNMQHLSAEDGLATLTACTAASIAAAFRHLPILPDKVILCGGGRHNDYLQELLRARLSCEAINCDRLGWHGDMLEAQAFSWLAIRCLYKLPISLPSTTGVSQPMTGGIIYPPL